MSERDGFEPGVPCWVDTLQPDPDAALRFYGGLFGWEFEGRGAMPGDPPGRYFVARLRGRDVAGVGSQPAAGAPPEAVWNTYIQVESADDSAEQVKGAGGTVVVEPLDALPAGRLAVVADPQGATFNLWEPRERAGAELVNEPGAWSMSLLNARDAEGAKAFYGAVFGWDCDTFETGDGAITMFRLPGFVGGEPQQPVPRDVVATMAPMSPERFPEEAPSHWSVDFWVGSVDSSTERSAALGGEVLAPPYDIPDTVLRQAAVADPQGAAFSITEVTAAP
jgi:predicted enzyme related to lactoylglutathione lyase